MTGPRPDAIRCGRLEQSKPPHVGLAEGHRVPDKRRPNCLCRKPSYNRALSRHATPLEAGDVFQEDKLYMTSDPALTAIGPYSTLAHWRSEGRGPRFIKLGSKVAYRGSDLNSWLAERTVEPKQAA